MDALDGGVMKNAGLVGAVLQEGPWQLKTEIPTYISEVQDIGCMLGLVCSRPAKARQEHRSRQGFLVNVTRDCVIRMLPLIITPQHVEEGPRYLRNSLKDWQLPS